jgi:hypothetical protein
MLEQANNFINLIICHVKKNFSHTRNSVFYYDDEDDIFNCNWVATRWHSFSTHIHTNNTGNVTNQTIQKTKKYIEQHKKYIQQHNN